MITYLTGDIFNANINGNRVHALVNPVNTVGVMGKGLALAFKQNYPINFKLYKKACENNELQVGKIFTTVEKERYIINFPTKQHWRAKSQLEWIINGLQDLRLFLKTQKITSIAIPALGAGLGGLDWALVKAEIETALADLTDIDILVFEPNE